MLRGEYTVKHNLEEFYDDPIAKKIKDDCENICDYMLDNLCSIRQCAENVGLSKSYVHQLIHSYIRVYYLEKYDQIIKLLKFNRRERSKSRRSWSKIRPW